MVAQHQIVIDAQDGDAHKEGVALRVLAAPVEVMHRETEQDRSSLTCLPDGPGLGDRGYMRREAVELHDGATALKRRHDKPDAVGKSEIKGWDMSETESLVHFWYLLSILVASWLQWLSDF